MDAFIDCALDSVTPGCVQWTVLESWKVRLPETDPSSALVVLGDPVLIRAFEATRPTMGWMLLKKDLEAQEDGREEFVRSTSLLVRRLGISATRLTIVATADSWSEAVDLVASAQAASLILLSLPGEMLAESLDRTFGDGVPGRFGFNRVLNTRAISDRTVLLAPDSAPSGIFENLPCDVARYPDSEVFKRYSVGLRKISLPLSQLAVVQASGGNVPRYLRMCWDGVGPNGSAGFLPSLNGDRWFARQLLMQFELHSGGLSCFGFDVEPRRKSVGWGSRRHILEVRNLEAGISSEFPLGVLRREILDSLPILTLGAQTQSYAAFGLPSNSPIVLNEFLDGDYELRILDEDGVDVLPNSAVRCLGGILRWEGRTAEIVNEGPGKSPLLCIRTLVDAERF